MIAYHFPPVQGSSGVQRTLKFSRYLLDHGWEPIVLTVHARAYERTDPGQLGEIAAGVHVHRAFALDSARHLSIGGRYPLALALPDRWVSWWLGAVPAGLRLTRRYRPQALWSTYPIASAHMIGATLARLTGLPWVADFRDSMTEPHYPPHSTVRRVYRWIEQASAARCRFAVFTTPGAVRMYANRYPELPAERWRLIGNGYDEESFALAEAGLDQPVWPKRPGQLVLLHSGLLYSSERDPRAFFAALEDLKHAGEIKPENFLVVLRASGEEDFYRELRRAHGLEELVALAPPLGYHDALKEMLQADGLLLFQAASCNHQIPAKLYEYLRAHRPILALTDAAGDTAATLRAAGVDSIVPLDSRAEIRDGLRRFLAQLRRGAAPVAAAESVRRHSRAAGAAELARLLDAAAESPAGE